MSVVLTQTITIERTIERACKRCAESYLNDKYPNLTPEDCDVVSQSGTGHLDGGHGMTACGEDATADSWWWRL